jgi:tRNA U55 pseudouridine synthase TruB
MYNDWANAVAAKPVSKTKANIRAITKNLTGKIHDILPLTAAVHKLIGSKLKFWA